MTFIGLLTNRWVQYGLLITAFFFFWRWSTNKAFDQGAANERIVVTREIEEAKKAEWAQKDADYQLKLKELDAAQNELARNRINLTNTLSKGIEEIKTREAVAGSAVSGIPADELDTALRELSAALGPPKP